MGVKETMCTNCVHLGICKNKNLFLEAQKSADELIVGAERSALMLKNIPWIRPIRLECINFMGKTTYRERGIQND